MKHEEFSEEHFNLMSAAGSMLDIMKTGIVQSGQSSPLFRAAVTTVIIELNFLLLAMAKEDERFDRMPFAAARPRRDGAAADLTEVVRRFRNSLCHAGGPEREWLGDNDDEGTVRVGWMVASAGIRGLAAFGGRVAPVAPPGDTMIATGGHFLMINADLLPAVDAALVYADMPWHR